MFTLLVAAENFVETIKRHSGTGGYPPIYAATGFGAPLLTAAFPERNFMIVALFEEENPDFEGYRGRVEGEGLRIYEGVWDIPRPPLPSATDMTDMTGMYEPSEGDGEEFFVASVGFMTPGAEEPYLWMDVYPYEPTEEEVLEDMLDWMSESEEESARTIEVAGVQEFRERYPYNVLISARSDLEDW